MRKFLLILLCTLRKMREVMEHDLRQLEKYAHLSRVLLIIIVIFLGFSGGIALIWAIFPLGQVPFLGNPITPGGMPAISLLLLVMAGLFLALRGGVLLKQGALIVRSGGEVRRAYHPRASFFIGAMCIFMGIAVAIIFVADLLAYLGMILALWCGAIGVLVSGEPPRSTRA